MRVLLTSSGLETKELQSYFEDMVSKRSSEIKALFIPTAAQYPDAIAVLPKCMNDLLKCGIEKENICVYDLHYRMTFDELRQYDVIYLCGGSPGYLLSRINDTGWGNILMEYIRNDIGTVIGVSAGSLIFSNTLSDNLGLVDTNIYVHCPNGERPGKLNCPLKNGIHLNGKCALAIRGTNDISIIGE